MITFTDGVTTVEVRNPSFGDPTRHSFKHLHDFTRSGALLVTTTAHPTFQTLEWSFTSLKKTVIDALVSFLESKASTSFTVTDYKNVTFTAYCTNESLEVITRRDQCGYDITLQLMRMP